MDTKIDKIINDLEQQGWSVQENYFPVELTHKLKNTLTSFRQQDLLKQAGIGRKKDFHIEQSIRSDKITWFDEEDLNPAQEEFLKTTNILKDSINKHFYLGLFELEVHFALYAPNAFYKRHLDQHKNQDTRVVTLISYLNENWGDDDGGELKIYLKNNKSVLVKPKAGTLVCFMSAEFEHEVLPAKRERASLTGWFRKRES